jgi:hypothetical protein
MLKRIAIGACLVCLIGGIAYAADEPAGDDTQCNEQLSKTEQLVDSKIEADALNEADVEKIDELLDEADSLCEDGKYKEASDTLATVTDMVSKPKQ